MYYNEAAPTALVGGNNIPTSPIERLRESEKRLTSQLEAVREAINTLESNPDINKVLNTLQRVQGLGGLY